jgi:hypothetical protein
LAQKRRAEATGSPAGRDKFIATASRQRFGRVVVGIGNVPEAGSIRAEAAVRFGDGGAGEMPPPCIR